MIKTKIIATLGPACESEEILGKMVDAGMSAARFNMSHGTHAEHEKRLDALRRVEKKKGTIISKIMDLMGPDVRIGSVEKDVILKKGKEFILTEESVSGNARMATILVSGLGKILAQGDRILVDDGKIQLSVDSTEGKRITCHIIVGGNLYSNKSLTFPNVDIELPFLSEKDRGDIAFAAKSKMDYISASFTRRAEDILLIRSHLIETRCGIIAKIEHPRALENIDDIIAVSDGVMVARGDLGVEIAMEEVPMKQKEIIRKSNIAGKPVITATQMLESMIENPLPTRAETSDVANAILDGSDAVMLSGETAMGKYPVEAVSMMARIAGKTEDSFESKSFPQKKTIAAAVCHSAYMASCDLDAQAIITPTQSGNTARLISQFRPACPIIALTTEEMAGKLALFWGVFPYLFDFKKTTDEMVESAIDRAKQLGWIMDGDIVVLTGGIPTGISKPTNMMKVHRVGEESVYSA